MSTIQGFDLSGLSTSDILILAIMALFAIGLLIGVFKLFRKPIKTILKLLIHIVSGFILLFVFNYLGGFIGLSLGINWVTAVIAGVLGVPGVILLLVIKYILL